MTCVVLGGSRKISRLNEDIRQRLDRIVAQLFPVVVGDANGADKALQKYFFDRGYKNVEVFCSGSSPRNNLGDWPCRQVATKARPGTFAFYVEKDRAMAEAATVGFMLWDGESVGTAVNVWRLLRKRKTSLVYVQAQRRFIEVRKQQDWDQLLSLALPGARRDIEERLKGESQGEPELPLFGPDLHGIGLA